ncbi:MAG: hypothetical protein M1816_000680 [Peltula sp. TS41687]|nr:MAG: hypothetical protein M1816_000680 [Peltula sp. TS41687]
MSSSAKQINGADTLTTTTTTTTTTTRTPFGHQMLQHFPFAKDFINLNHGLSLPAPALFSIPLINSTHLGSFGTSPHPVREMMHRYQNRVESRPDPFLRYDYPDLLDTSRRAMADFVHAPADEIVFVTNATTGVNAVLRSLVFEKGDSILYFNTTYGSCAKTVEYVCETTPAKGVRLTLEYPIEDDDLLRVFRDAIRKENGAGAGKMRVAIIDTIISMPGVRMPFEKMVEVCRQEGVLSLVDGAHGVGHIDLNLSQLDADFFVSNCHKWLFTPRPSAVFHVPNRNQPLIRSSIPTSHGFIPKPSPSSNATHTINPLPRSSKPPFIALFEFVGTIDPAPYLSLPAALEFRVDVCGGESAIRDYCFDLARRGGQLVADILRTKVLTPSASGDTCFSNVRLPIALPADWRVEDVAVETRSEVAQDVMRTLADEHDTFVAVVWHGRAWWARLSAQVYLDLEDFRWVAGVLERVCGAVSVEGTAKGKEGGDGKRGVVDGEADLDGVEGMVESVAIN